VLRCRVETFGFSAHSDRDGLAGYLERTAPKNVVFVHGDPAAVDWFKTSMALKLPDTQLLAALPGAALEL